jgi:hypothetical protein
MDSKVVIVIATLLEMSLGDATGLAAPGLTETGHRNR